MEWPDCKSLELIQLYREKRSPWDPLDKNYKNNKIKFDDWQEIATKLNTDVTNIKKKIESLQGSYCRGTDDLYKSKWFAFNEMQFLKEKYKPRQTKDSMNILN